MTRPHPFGVLAFLHWNHDWNNWHFNPSTLDRAFIQLQELGVGFVRMDFLWHEIHDGSNRYRFDKYRELVAQARQHGLAVLGVLHYNKQAILDGKEVWNQPPDSFDEFADFVAATVGQFKDDVKYWEVWNEPNLGIYWAAPRDGLKSYSDLLRKSYAAAKRADPSCTVLNGGLTEPIIEDVANLYAHAGNDCFDILNLHTFIDPLDAGGSERFDGIIRGVEEIMRRHGDAAKPIWITEMGCPGAPPDRKDQTWFGGRYVSEEQQADWLERQYQMIAKYPRIEKLFWAFYRDTENEFKDLTDYLGLVRLDLSPKPAFHRMKRLIQEFKTKMSRPPTGSTPSES